MDSVTLTRNKYSVKEGSQVPRHKAQIYGDFIEVISDQCDHKLNAEIIVEKAMPQNSPIHDYFEWNNTKAAHEYRLIQARKLLRSLVIYDEKSDRYNRAYINVEIENEELETDNHYVPLEDILNDNDLTRKMLADALEYLKWFKLKYSMLKELAEVHNAIDKIIKK